MLDSVLITGIILILTAGALAVVMARIILGKSLFFKIVAVITVPILNAVFMGFLIGVQGFEIAIWAVLWGIFLILVGYFFAAKILKNPLNLITEKVELLSKGDLNLSCNSKYLKGNSETARVMRKLAQLVGSLKTVANFADHVGRGELNVDYELLGENDILGKAMLDMRANLQRADAETEKRQLEDEQRNWATQGLAKFAEILRKDNDNLETLSYNVISNLVKYLDANQGGIFVLNDAEKEEDKLLEMKACYAYDRKKFADKQIRLGEGLVGACFLEGEPIYMTNIPNEYIAITSGLGDSNPKAILICPLKVNDEVFGVIELASFQKFEPYQLEFVQKVSESIASTIGSVKVAIRTTRLLTQSKLQAEEMANQEEELRQNMEEMQATQEEMFRRENDLQETLKQMQEVQNRMEAIGNNLPSGVMFRLVRYRDQPGKMRMEYVSAQWKAIIGLPSESVQNDMSSFFAIVHPDDHQPLLDAFEESIKTDTFYIEIRIKRDGAYRWLRISSHPHSDEKRLIWDGIMTDITARKKSERTFEEKVHWYEALLDAFYESPISVTDMNKNITFLNKAALDILGTTREETMGKYCGDVWGVDICKDGRCGIECMKRGEGKSVFHVGDQVFTTFASYIKDTHGAHVGHIEVVSNITEATNKTAYNKKEVDKLSTNISKLATGDLHVDFSVDQPDMFTEEEYENFNVIASNLEQVRNAMKKFYQK